MKARGRRPSAFIAVNVILNLSINGRGCGGKNGGLLVSTRGCRSVDLFRHFTVKKTRLLLAYIFSGVLVWT